MKFHWLVPSFLGVVSTLLISCPVQAGNLQTWRFNSANNQLVFTTDDAVQPRAQLIFNPTRLVIDLPGTRLGRPMVSQPVGGAIREVRVGQFDAETARIVVELNPGYTIDPQQVRFRGITPTQWTVQLPTPQVVAIEPPGTSQPPSPGTTPPPVATNAATQLQSVRVTADGFFIRTSGTPPQIEVDRDRNQVSIDFANTALSPQLQREVAVNRFGVDRLQFTQVSTSPPVARLTFNVSGSAANWRATVSNLGGVVLVPTGGVIANDRPPPTPTTPAPRQPATIQAVELTADGSQLLIRSDRAVTFTSGWERSTGLFRIAIADARLAERVTGPQLGSRSPLLRVRLRQEGESVVILVQPATGTRLGVVNQPSSQLLALQLQTTSQGIPVPPPTNIPTPPPVTNPLPPTSRPPQNGRIVVVIDPGHGGPDPGAVGIGGLRETDIVLSVGTQIAALLEQQGVQVILTRRDERDLDLEPRVQIAERANADLFVSVHANSISLSRPDVNGVETYYYSDRGLGLAQIIHNQLLQVPGTRDRGVRQARFYVIRNTSMPAVLLELGFVTGASDARLLADPTVRSQMAAAITRGILQYIQQNL